MIYWVHIIVIIDVSWYCHVASYVTTIL